MEKRTARRVGLYLVILATLPISAPLVMRNKIRKRRRKIERQLQKDAQRHTQKPKPPTREINGKIVDLRRKLWEGFGEQTANEIERLVDTGKLGAFDKAQLMYELARWFASKGDWVKAAALMTDAVLANSKFCERPRPMALLAESLIQSGAAEKALEVARAEKSESAAVEMALAESNALFAIYGTSADKDRLAILNQLYRQGELAEISLRDPSRRLAIDNLSCGYSGCIEDGSKVSIIVPVYNAEAHLEETLNSLRAQTWANLEIILIDDQSPDSSWEIIKAHAAQDQRIKSARNERNSGAYTTRNRALRMATGDYVTVHDSDDWSHPQMIERQVGVLRATKGCRGVFGTAARVDRNIRYQVRPHRPNLEILHRSYPSFMARLSDVLDLGGWDEVNTNADDELVKRFVMKFGKDSVLDKIARAPLTLQLHHNASLTQAATTTLTSLSHGLRRTYTLQAEQWHREEAAKQGSFKLARTGLKEPFPVPQLIVRQELRRGSEYDLVLISDMTLLGGTRRCNQGYIAAATAAGLRVGLFHYPRWDFHFKDISPDYFDLCRDPNVDFLTKEDVITAKLCIVHHPPILKFSMDQLPQIDTEFVGVLVNQSPMQLRSEKPWMYDPEVVRAACQKYFGRDPVWISISNRVKHTLTDLGGYEPMHSRIWHPPHSQGVDLKVLPPVGLSERRIVIGRHSRDHWTKWPANAEDIRNAFCADEPDIETRILGGMQSVENSLSAIPVNWAVQNFDATSVSDFIEGLDVFVNFMHFDYIEEFGRNTMEAMAHGKPVVLEEGLRDIFGDAAIYCKPQEVADVVRALVNDHARYVIQAQKGLAFVQENCVPERVKENLLELISNSSASHPINTPAEQVP